MLFTSFIHISGLSDVKAEIYSGHLPSETFRSVILLLSPLQRHIVVDTFFGYDEESMDSESSSVASFRMDRTPATPDEDLDDMREVRLSFPSLSDPSPLEI